MNNKETEKAPIVVSKSFMAVGPTLHYSHKNVQRCWFLAVAAFVVSCFFWSKITTGSFWSFDIQAAARPQSWHLGQTIISGVSIFEYPWQIVVLGLLMGILSIVPVLISQLMSFGYSFPLILSVFFFGQFAGLRGLSIGKLYCGGVSASSFSLAFCCDSVMHGTPASLLGILRRCQGGRTY